jgi:hypothetical protein
MFLVGSWLVTVQIRYLYRVDAETQGHPLVSPSILHIPSFKVFQAREVFTPRAQNHVNGGLFRIQGSRSCFQEFFILAT